MKCDGKRAEGAPDGWEPECAQDAVGDSRQGKLQRELEGDHAGDATPAESGADEEGIGERGEGVGDAAGTRPQLGVDEVTRHGGCKAREQDEAEAGEGRQQKQAGQRRRRGTLIRFGREAIPEGRGEHAQPEYRGGFRGR